MKIFIFEHHRADSVLRLGSHGIAGELQERGHEIVWFGHPRSLFHRLLGAVAPLRVRYEEHLEEVTLRTLAPYVRLPGLGTLAWGLRWLTWGCRTSTVLRQQRLDRCDLLWLSDFTMLPILDLIEAETVVFRFFDHLDEFRWTPHSIFDLISVYQGRADLILASSKDVRRGLAERGISACYLPNGANIDLFSKAEAVRAEREQRCVYVGAIDRWFDLPAVEYWATRLPDVEFLLVGPNNAGFRSRLANVVFVGQVPYERLRKYLARASVGLIPFKVNDLTRGVHPIKLYDYAAAGCPVLAADLPEVPADQAGIYTYRTRDEGLEILKRCLSGEVDRHRLRHFALENSWKARVDVASSFLKVQL